MSFGQRPSWCLAIILAGSQNILLCLRILSRHTQSDNVGESACKRDRLKETTKEPLRFTQAQSTMLTVTCLLPLYAIMAKGWHSPTSSRTHQVHAFLDVIIDGHGQPGFTAHCTAPPGAMVSDAQRSMRADSCQGRIVITEETSGQKQRVLCAGARFTSAILKLETKRVRISVFSKSHYLIY